MLRYTVVTLLLAGLLGCESGAPEQPLGKGPSESEQPQLAAYAARAEYPSEKTASTDLTAAAMVDRDHKTITLRNFSDKNLRNVHVWVDGTYVRLVNSIPAHGTVALSTAQFYDSSGRSLANQGSSISRVQVETEDALYTLQGPQYGK